jgi:hypothetical protein
MEEENKLEIQRSSCTTCVVNTGETLIVVENTGANNVHTQTCS